MDVNHRFNGITFFTFLTMVLSIYEVDFLKCMCKWYFIIYMYFHRVVLSFRYTNNVTAKNTFQIFNFFPMPVGVYLFDVETYLYFVWHPNVAYRADECETKNHGLEDYIAQLSVVQNSIDLFVSMLLLCAVVVSVCG
jgi:hypothetical protein